MTGTDQLGPIWIPNRH